MPTLWNPCCGYSLKKAVIIIAYIDLVASVVTQVGRVTLLDADQLKEEANKSLMEFKFHSQDNEARLMELAKEIYKHVINYVVALMLTHLAVLVFITFEAWMYSILMRSSKKGDARGCKLWLWMRTISMVFYFWIIACVISYEAEYKWIDYAPLFTNLFRFYEILVVYQFMKEINTTCSGVERL